MDYRIRNEQITKDVLNGFIISKVAKKHNLSNERIRQIVAGQCRTINPLEYEKINHRSTVNVPELRKRKQYFLSTPALPSKHLEEV